MAQNYQRDLAIRQAEALLNSGYDNEYVQKKLIKEGFVPIEAESVIRTLTGKAAAIPRHAIEQPLILDDLSQNPFPVQPPAPSQQAALSQQVSSLPNPDSETARRDAKRQAIALLDNGYGLNAVHERLIQQGYSKATVNEVLSSLSSRKTAAFSAYQQSMDRSQRERDDESEKREKQKIKGWLMLGAGVIFGFFALQSEDVDTGTFLTLLGVFITGIYSIVKSSMD